MPKQITPGESASITTADWQDTYQKPYSGAGSIAPNQPAYHTDVDESNARIDVVTHAYYTMGNYAYAAVGKSIEMTQTNSDRTAVFDFSGYLKAQAASLVAASAEVTISMFVLRANTGSSRPLSEAVAEEEMAKRVDDFVRFVYAEEDRTWGGSAIDKSISDLAAEDRKLEVYPGNLIGGEQYYVGLLVETAAGAGGTGHAQADAASSEPISLPFDYDGYVTYDTINVNWS